MLAAWAVLVWITGGVVFDIGGLRVSSRSATRPAVLAVAMLAAAAGTLSAAERRARLVRARQVGDRAAAPAAVLLALTVAGAAALLGGHLAGGADASGYVSQSRHWTEGRIRVPAPDLVGAPWPDRGWLVAPLGYAPSHVVGELGHTYAPGLPWLMALGAAVFGEGGRYLWTPLFVGLFVWGTFLLARRDAPALVALSAAILAGTSPPVLFAAMQTMSDLPASALWLGALLTIGSPRAGVTVASGALAALAIVVRPNLAAVGGALWLASTLARALPTRSAQATDGRPLPHPLPDQFAHAALWAAPVVVASLAIAAVNTMVWGAPTASGYGANADLFRTANVPQNVARLWRWTTETGGYWSLIGLVGLVWSAVVDAPRRAWPRLALVAAVLASYVVYAVFEEWWYLRFYLPAWPALAAAAAVAVWRLLARWSDDAAVMAVAALALTIGAGATSRTAAIGAFELWKSEQRYAAVAGFVATQAPPGAVVLSVQHSGAVAYYSARTIVRWDYIAPGDLDGVCERLAAAGHQAWLVVDDWEEAPFRQRFAAAVRGRLDWAPLGEARVGTARVRIYDLTTPTRAIGPAMIPVLTGAVWPWTRIPVPAAAK